MTAYTNTRDNNVLPGAGYKDGDTLTTVNGSKWVYQNENWHPIAFGGSPEEQPLTVRRSDGRVGNPGGPLLMSVGDASIGVAGNPGCGPYKKSELLPTHRAVFNPELASLSDVTTTAGVVASLDNETEPGEFYRKSLGFTMAGAAASNVQRVLLPADTLFGSTKRKFGYHTHLRIYCSDWSKVTNLSLSPYTGASDMHEFWIVKSGVCDSGCMDPAFSSRWNAKFRTFQFHASTRNKGGSPAAWGTGRGVPADFDADGFMLRIATSGACVIKINRIYSSHWPCGAFVAIGDGAYKAFKGTVFSDFRKRGWHGGVSLFQDVLKGPIYPDYSDLSDFANAGWDVFPHMRNATTEIAFTGTEDADTIAKSHRVITSQIRSKTTARAPGLRFAQFLQGSGKSNVAGGIYMAQEIARNGVETARAFCPDSEWGVNPHASSTFYNENLNRTILGTGQRSSGNDGWQTGWVSPRGRFNHWCGQFYSVDTVYQGASTPALRDTYQDSMLQTCINRAAEYGTVTWQFTHEVVPYDGAQPTIYNSGTAQWAAALQDLDSYFKAGQLIMLSPSEHAKLTYLRDDDVFLRWDGEWVYRQDPTKIAF